MTSIISLENVSKIYKTKTIETHAVSSVNLTINKGDYLAITGKSGSGKSTLLNLIGLLDSPSIGTYKYLGYITETLNQKQLAKLRNKEIGYVFQSFNLIESLNIYDNIALPMVYRGFKKNQIKDTVIKLSTKFEFLHRIKHYPNELSGGQQQRVAIARALVNNPSLLILDEPTGNLDSENSKIVMDIIDKLNSNSTTICLVTHDMEFANRAKEIVVMSDGQLSNL